MFKSFLHSLSHLPQAGRLKHFLPAWEQITKDPWILQVVSGYQIEFLDYPVQHKTPALIPCTQDHQTIIDQEVQELLSKGQSIRSKTIPIGNPDLSAPFL